MDQDERQQLLEKADELRYNGEYDDAIAIYDQLLSADDSFGDARHGRALAYCFTGLFDESIADLERVRDDSPQDVKARIDLFKTYLMLGMNDEAVGEMKAVLKLDPNNEEVHKHKAYFPGEF